jgi:hypothetical protein
MGELRLEAREWQSAARWRWVLTTEPGDRFLADHEVRLDESYWQYKAFHDLRDYLRWRATPDRRIAQEAEIVAQVGEWIGAEVFGAVGPAMVAQRPATVRVVVPAEAGELVFRPLELGHVGGRPLAVQKITLVMHAEAAPPSAAMGESLRGLGLFSLPAGGRALNLRRERHALLRLFTEIAAVQGRAIDVRVLQYGVTRDRLRDVLDEDEGWDIVHISGHGAPGELLLEAEDGSADRVGAGDLADLLDVTRERLKLVTVSACWSAALTTAEHLRLLGLPAPAGPVREDEDERADPPPDGVQPAALATELVDRLGCAVLAMRFPVIDDFAIDLAERLYGKLVDKGQPLARALGLALPEVLTDPPTVACPPLSVATPTLFGGLAVDLRLRAPDRTRPQSYDTELLKLAAFPQQPERFVGRVAVMTRASAALAPRSGVSGVLLYGMPGAGKSACALELAYTHEHTFEKLVWFKAPDEGRDITGSLADFALTLERALSGLQFVHLLEDPEKLRGFVPELTELCEQRRVLIVFDNAEALLTESGQWRDDRWGLLVAALAGHSGLGRFVMTSRRRPEGLDSRVTLEPIDALSLDETLLLARELPHLGALLDGAVPEVDAAAAARLAAGVLEVAQGHPKLLELADDQAADPERLRELVRLAEAAWQEAGGLPEGFFTTGQTRAAGADYLHVLHSWTSQITATLPAEDRDLFFFLCCLEEDDRIGAVLDDNWADLWARLGREGAPSALAGAVGRLVATGLVAGVVTGPPGSQDGAVLFGVHPGVAAAGRQLAGPTFRSAVDIELAAFWMAVAQQAMRGDQDGGGESTGVVVRAGLSAAPYLMRLGRWADARWALEQALVRDGSRTVVAAVVPWLQRIAQEFAGTAKEPAALRVLAQALAEIDPGTAERLLRETLAAAVARQDYPGASSAVGGLVELCLRSGRLAEALRLADDQIDYTRRAGLGPWTRLSGQVQRLQVLAAREEEAERVLAEAERLRDQMTGLPQASPQPETAMPWNVREALLGAGREAARCLGRWQAALEWNAAVAASERDRGAPQAEVARTRFHHYGPLLRLGRVDAAVGVLRECREIFERAHDVRMLGKVLSAMADAEDMLGHGEVAIGLVQDALRYSYLAGDVAAIAVSHHNLGNYLCRSADGGRPAGGAVAHHLASAVLCAVTGGEGLEVSVRDAAADVRVLGEETALPQDTAQLCGLAGQVPGVALDRLLTTLTGDLQAVQPILEDLTAQVRTLAGEKE